MHSVVFPGHDHINFPNTCTELVSYEVIHTLFPVHVQERRLKENREEVVLNYAFVGTRLIYSVGDIDTNNAEECQLLFCSSKGTPSTRPDQSLTAVSTGGRTTCSDGEEGRVCRRNTLINAHVAL